MEGTIDRPVEAKPRPWSRWLNYSLQVLWVLAAVFVVQIYIVSMRPGYVELMRVCTEPVCVDGQLTEEGVESLRRLGISLPAYSIFQIVFIFSIAAIYATVSLMIFRARRNDNVALYTALVLLLFGAFLGNFVEVMRIAQPGLADFIDFLPGLTLIAFAILRYIFPDGRFVPRWTRWAAWGWIAAPIMMTITIVLNVYETAVVPITVFLLILLGTCIVAPIYRYRRLATHIQRQQLKWVLFGLAQLLTTLLVVVELLPLIFPALDVAGSAPNLLSNIFQAISLALFPVTIGIALLRHRLWNVDLVINRTLVYVPLTSILTVIYTTSLAVGQRVFATATGEQSQAIAIFTTIILTTTFTPIKNALQSYVDSYFKEAPGNLKELKELNKQVSQIVQTLDPKSLAQRVVETIVGAHNARGAALYLLENEKMVLAYATPDWVGAEGEVSILLSEQDEIYGRLLLGQRSDRDDYTLDEVEEIRESTLPIVRNMHRLAAIQELE
jgi:hypothetical protein